MSKPIHWQCDDNLYYNSFWCELDPEKTPQRSGYDCRFCHDAEVQEKERKRIAEWLRKRSEFSGKYNEDIYFELRVCADDIERNLI